MSIYLTCTYNVHVQLFTSSITVTMCCASSLFRLECRLSQRKVRVHSIFRIKLTLPARPSQCGASVTVYMYHSVAKERPRAEHLTSLPKRRVGAFSCVSAFNHKRGRMYAYSDSLPLNLLKYRTNNNMQWSRRPWKLKF